MRTAARIVVAIALAGVLLGASAALGRSRHHAHRRSGHPHTTRAALDPVVFVHGFSGSGAQFESQALRLTSNGYPIGYVAVLEYDSTQYAGSLYSGQFSSQQEAALFDQLDQLIAHMKAVTHRPQVELLAHSLGTKLMQDYLNSSPQRAANVAHYVNIDGQTADAPPGGVKTLALWGTKGPLSSKPGRQIRGAQNVTIPDSTHVQCATSPLSFYYFYKLFTGRAPRTTAIVAQKGTITLAGRAVNFPQNSGLSGATVQVWPIDQATGQRASSTPIASTVVGQTGDWGPVAVRSRLRYELTLVRTDNPSAPVHHFYYEPFVRSDHLIRLLESDALRSAGGPPDPRSVAMVITRYKELWGDQGAESDVLTANGISLCNATTCPLDKLVNGLFVGDFNHDGASETDQTWAPYQNASQYFLSSVDAFLPAASPPAGEVTIGLRSRGQGPERTLTFPNFAGTTDDVTVQLNDYDQVSSPTSTTGRRSRCTAPRRRGGHARRCRTHVGR